MPSFALLGILVAAAPLTMAFDQLLVQGFLAAYIAVTVALVTWTRHPGEAAHFVRLSRAATLIALMPALWIVIQILPMPLEALQNTIWGSARSALGETISGRITISPGHSLIGLIQYLSAAGLFLASTAIAIDRSRAESILLELAAVTTAVAMIAIVHNTGGFYFLGEISSTGPRSAISASAVLGAIWTAATAIYALERYETRHSRPNFTASSLVAIAALALAGFVLCWLAIALYLPTPNLFAAFCGLEIFALPLICRRLGLSPKLGLLVCVIGVILPLSLIAQPLLGSKDDLTLRFIADAPADVFEVTRRIVSDAPWLGFGANVFSALLPIYQTSADIVVSESAPSTAAGIVIALGRPFLWLALAAAIIATVYFLYGSLRRGRDSFYSAAAAGSVVVTTIEAFFDAGLMQPTVWIFIVTALGLGLAQSASRTLREQA